MMISLELRIDCGTVLRLAVRGPDLGRSGYAMSALGRPLSRIHYTACSLLVANGFTFLPSFLPIVLTW